MKAMAAHPQHWLTPEEYLEIERAAQNRHEYYNGRMYAMAGGSYWHGVISGNLVGELRSALKSRACTVTPSDLRVCVAANGLYTYPDIVVVCNEPKFVDRRSDTVLNPSLLIEVLSPSTELADREFKAKLYQQMGSLREYAFVAQTKALVEVYRRSPEGGWPLAEFVGVDAVARFDSIEVSVPLAEIYSKVQFGEEDA